MSRNLDLSEKFEGLFQPYRYKVAYGGRTGMKSWTFARVLLLLGRKRKLRIMCTREVQKSIKESVHYLLKSQVANMKLGAFYDIQRDTIIGRNGTEFIFAGLSDLTADSIKSYEGVDIVWCEEAHKITKNSWNILIPTIRKSGSEIWISLNPELDTDETWVRFVVNPPPRTLLIPVSYRDTVAHGWASAETLAEIQTAKDTMTPEDFGNIWDGKPRAAAVGAIYAPEMLWLTENRRIQGPVDYDSGLKVHAVMDLGFNDSMAIAFVQRHLSSVRVIDYMEDSQKLLSWYSARMREKDYNWGKVYMPHDAKHHNILIADTPRAAMEKLGWDVEITPDIGVEHGIKLTREVLRRTHFDGIKCARLIECMKRYRRNVPLSTGEPGAPVHDAFSHGADTLRYVAVNAAQMTNDSFSGKKLVYPKHNHA